MYYWIKYKVGNDPEKIKLCKVNWNFNSVGDVEIWPICERFPIYLNKSMIIDYEKVQVPKFINI